MILNIFMGRFREFFIEGYDGEALVAHCYEQSRKTPTRKGWMILEWTGVIRLPNFFGGQTIQIYGRDFTYNSALFGLVIYNNIRNKNNPLAILLVTFLGWLSDLL